MVVATTGTPETDIAVMAGEILLLESAASLLAVSYFLKQHDLSIANSMTVTGNDVLRPIARSSAIQACTQAMTASATLART
jgi:hypothetical protein